MPGRNIADIAADLKSAKMAENAPREAATAEAIEHIATAIERIAGDCKDDQGRETETGSVLNRIAHAIRYPE